jgi:predicted DCC family thiol-disulfide oxidoreductase YuxK
MEDGKYIRLFGLPFAGPRSQIAAMPATTIPPRAAPAPVTLDHDLLFYDGTCGFCHRWVLFVLRHDPSGLFRFAPIGGETWNALIQSAGEPLPDSLVLRTIDGRTLVRSQAVRQIGERLGDGWRTMARTAGLLPGWLLDLGYDGIARTRRLLFARPPGVCPIVPAELRARFLP